MDDFKRRLPARNHYASHGIVLSVTPKDTGRPIREQKRSPLKFINPGRHYTSGSGSHPRSSIADGFIRRNDPAATQGSIGLKDDEHFRKTYLLPALETGLIEMTVPDKPRSSKQKYRLTGMGRKRLSG